MDAGTLHRIARVLREAALAATADAGEPPQPLSLVLVTEDIAQHGDTTVTEVAARTGFAQSLVSGVVARLRAAGVVEARVDESDRRRTRIAIAGAARESIFAPRAARGISDALAEGLPGRSREQVAEVERLLEALAVALGIDS